MVRATPRKRRVRSPETRRDDILEVALRLFREHGFVETSMQQIASAAGVAIGTVYLYYSSKDEVLVECHRRFRDQLARSVEDAVLAPLEEGEEVDLRAALETVVRAIADFAMNNRDLCRVTLTYTPATRAVGASERVSHVLVDVLERARERGLVDVTDIDVTVTLLVRMLGHSICSAAAFGEPPLDRVIPVATELTYRSLTAR